MTVSPPAASTSDEKRRSSVEGAMTGARPAAYVTELVRGDAIAAELERQLSEGATATVFQTPEWLRLMLDGVAPKNGASPLLAIVRERDGGALVMSLPLLVYRRRGTTIAEGTDLGLSDYCAPVLGAAAPSDADGGRRAAEALVAGLDGIDLLRMRKMPAEVEGIANPLTHLAGISPSKFNGNRLRIEATVEAFLASRGKKYRKEAERSWRRLQEIGPAVVKRATKPGEIASAYAALEAWQSTRHRDAGNPYWLDLPEVSAFYRDLVLRNVTTGAASIYTLSVGGELAAVVLGVTHHGAFTLLRIGDGGEEWRHCSPGRMIVLGVMRDLVADGVRVFDMGIGDYPFKRWIGCAPYPLFDIDFARTWKGKPASALKRLEKSIRANPRVLALVRRLTGRGGPTPRAEEQD